MVARRDLPAITSTDGMKLAALFDPSRERLAKMGAKFGVEDAKLFTDAEAFSQHAFGTPSVFLS